VRESSSSWVVRVALPSLPPPRIETFAVVRPARDFWPFHTGRAGHSLVHENARIERREEY